MKIILDHIKNQSFKSMYLLYGEERYLVTQFKDNLKKAIIGDDSMNYSYYEGEKLSIKEILATADTMPFFAERRLIVIENSGFFKNQAEEFAEYIKNGLPEYLHIVFVETDVDKRSKMYKAVNSAGYVAEMKIQTENDLIKWITGKLAKENKHIEIQTASYLIAKVGMELSNINSEITKLICYCYDRPVITVKDIDAICTTQIQNKIFDMITAISLKKQKEALDMYYDLLLLREPPMKILALIVRQFNMLLQTKEFTEKRIDNKTMASKLGVAPFLIPKLMNQAKSFTIEQLKEALEFSAIMETDFKSGRIEDKLAVEMIIIKYSKAAR